MKKVTIGLTMSTEFVRMLNANVSFSQLREKEELTPSQILALCILAEARGDLEENVDAMIPVDYEGDLVIEHGMRTVEEVGLD